MKHKFILTELLLLYIMSSIIVFPANGNNFEYQPEQCALQQTASGDIDVGLSQFIRFSPNGKLILTARGIIPLDSGISIPTELLDPYIGKQCPDNWFDFKFIGADWIGRNNEFVASVYDNIKFNNIDLRKYQNDDNYRKQLTNSNLKTYLIDPKFQGGYKTSILRINGINPVFNVYTKTIALVNSTGLVISDRLGNVLSNFPDGAGTTRLFDWYAKGTHIISCVWGRRSFTGTIIDTVKGTVLTLPKDLGTSGGLECLVMLEDGKTLLLATETESTNGDVKGPLWKLKVNGHRINEQTLLINDRSVRYEHLKYCAVSHKLFVACSSKVNSNISVLTMNEDGSNQQILWSGRILDPYRLRQIAVSPDGKTVAFWARVIEGGVENEKLVVVDTKTKSARMF